MAAQNIFDQDVFGLQKPLKLPTDPALAGQIGQLNAPLGGDTSTTPNFNDPFRSAVLGQVGNVQTDPANDAGVDTFGSPAAPMMTQSGPFGTPYVYGNAGSAGYMDVGEMQLAAPNSDRLQVPGTSIAPQTEEEFWANVRSLQNLGGAPLPQKSTPSSAGAPGASMSSPSMMTDPSMVNPGVAIGGQQAYKNGPVVATSRVGYGDLPDLETDFAAASQRGAEAAYKGATQFFDKDFGQDRADLETQLQAQGFVPGTEGYTRELDRMERGQNSARENAAFMAQGVGHQQAGDLLARALQTRATKVGERSQDADRLFAQSMGIAGLGLGARGQDIGLQGTQAGASASMSNAAASAEASKYGTDASATLALRRLGLDENNQEFAQLMQLMAGARGGVNMPTFGTPTPIDVGGANSIASNNANSAANRSAADRAALYQLGGAALGSFFGK